MNLNSSPKIEQLKALTSQADDDAGDHILWVDDGGEVHLSLIADELTPNGFEDSKPSMRLRYETCGQGNGYVGEEAAKDESLMGRIFRSLVKEWADLNPSDHSRYIDNF